MYSINSRSNRPVRRMMTIADLQQEEKKNKLQGLEDKVSELSKAVNGIKQANSFSRSSLNKNQRSIACDWNIEIDERLKKLDEWIETKDQNEQIAHDMHQFNHRLDRTINQTQLAVDSLRDLRHTLQNQNIRSEQNLSTCIEKIEFMNQQEEQYKMQIEDIQQKVKDLQERKMALSAKSLFSSPIEFVLTLFEDVKKKFE